MIVFALPDLSIRLEQTGCGHHPTLKDHRLYAAWLERIIDAHPGIWDGK
jgi:hypothetical protein